MARKLSKILLNQLLLSPVLRLNQHLQCQKGEIHIRCVHLTTTLSSFRNASSSMLIRMISLTRVSFPQRLQPSLKILSKNLLQRHSPSLNLLLPNPNLNLSLNLRRNLNNHLRPAQLLPLSMSLLQLPPQSLRHPLPQHSHPNPPRNLLPHHSPLQRNPSQRGQSLKLVTHTSCARITSAMRRFSHSAFNSIKTRMNSLRNQPRSLKVVLKVLHLALNSPPNLSRNPLSSSSQHNSHNQSLKLHLKSLRPHPSLNHNNSHLRSLRLHLSLNHSSSRLKSLKPRLSLNLLLHSNHLQSLRLPHNRHPNQLSPSSHPSLRRLPSRNLNSQNLHSLHLNSRSLNKHLSHRLQSLLRKLLLKQIHLILAVLIRASLLST